MTQIAHETPSGERHEDGGWLAGYDPKRGGVPLAGYAALVGAYLAGLGAVLAVGRRRLPRRVAVGDVLLVGIATHKLARIATRDWVTAPLRAPFTELQGSAGSGEVDEKARGTGLQRAIGDLATCPFCSAPWIATALAAGLSFAPRQTRFVASVFTSVTISDFLHQAYRRAMPKAA